MNLWTAHIESLHTRYSLLHGWGTLRGSGEPPSKAWLEVNRSECGVARIPAIFGIRYRSTDRRYLNIGFILYGTLNDIACAHCEFLLVLEWPDRRQMQLSISKPRLLPAGRGVARIRTLPWTHYFSRGMRLVRQRQLGLLLRKLAKMLLAYFHSGWDPARLLQWVEAEGKPLALVIDHDLGGGANLYRCSFIDRLLSEGIAPVLLTAHNGMLAYQLEAKRGTRTRIAHVEELDTLFDALNDTPFVHLVFNNILSFPEPLAFVEALTDWLKKGKVEKFIFLVHDHYCICPSWLLLNDAGTYCGIPDTLVCARCLPANASPFLEFVRGIDIVSWRRIWGALLLEADEVRCFSNATRKLLVRSHPQANHDRVTVVPHTLDHVRLRQVRLNDPGWPVIAVIGHISYHKGGQIVQELAKHIRVAGSRAHIVVVGTTEYDLPKESTTVTGRYRPEDLPELLEFHGVNVGFFPSVCPETFSYVTEEMIMMGLPVLAFDLGAPGERVAQYTYGRVIPLDSPKRSLEAIEDLYSDYVRNSEIRQS